MEKRAVVLDIASDFNRGDAIMQKAYGLLLQRIDVSDVTGIGIYGYNEGRLADSHYDESKVYFKRIFHGLRRTYNLSEKNSFTKIKNVFSLVNIWILVLLPVVIWGEQKRRYREIISKLNNSDLIIWNGRNFRNRKGFGEFYDLLCFIYLPVVVLLRTRKSMVFYGVSIWPLKYKLSRALVMWLLRSPRIEVWAREQASVEVLNDYKIDNRRCMDLSFPVLSNIVKNARNNVERDIEMVLTLTDWVEDGLLYRSNYVKIIANLVKAKATLSNPVLVLPQVYPDWESYTEILAEIVNEIGDDRLVISIQDKLSHAELCDFYLRSKLVVTTRMHGAIFAAWCGASVVSIAYDAGSKWSILRDLGCFETVVNFKDLTTDNLSYALGLAKEQNVFDHNHILENIEKDLQALQEFI